MNAEWWTIYLRTQLMSRLCHHLDLDAVNNYLRRNIVMIVFFSGQNLGLPIMKKISKNNKVSLSYRYVAFWSVLMNTQCHGQAKKQTFLIMSKWLTESLRFLLMSTYVIILILIAVNTFWEVPVVSGWW